MNTPFGRQQGGAATPAKPFVQSAAKPAATTMSFQGKQSNGAKPAAGAPTTRMTTSSPSYPSKPLTSPAAARPSTMAAANTSNPTPGGTTPGAGKPGDQKGPKKPVKK